jgi:ElaB/YqjD/DUF883 family membrane-anchored ribosome-binding protein
MKSENNPSASASDTTSTSKPKEDAPKKEEKRSEADFISDQQSQAKAAISQTLADMKRAVADGADVREWTRQHPWILMGSAAIVGTLLGRLITPSKDEKFKEFFEEKWEKMKDRFTPAPEEVAAKKATEPQEKGSMFGSILRESMKAVGPALVGVITNLMDQNRGQEDAENGHEGNGKHAHEDAPHTPN